MEQSDARRTKERNASRATSDERRATSDERLLHAAPRSSARTARWRVSPTAGAPRGGSEADRAQVRGPSSGAGALRPQACGRVSAPRHAWRSPGGRLALGACSEPDAADARTPISWAHACGPSDGERCGASPARPPCTAPTPDAAGSTTRSERAVHLEDCVRSRGLAARDGRLSRQPAACRASSTGGVAPRRSARPVRPCPCRPVGPSVARLDLTASMTQRPAGTTDTRGTSPAAPSAVVRSAPPGPTEPPRHRDDVRAASSR